MSNSKYIASQLVIVALLISMGFLSSCLRKEIAPDFFAQSSLEKISKDGKKFVADNDSTIFFNSSKYQTSKLSRSGKFSVYSTPKNPYILASVFKNVYLDSYVEATVWKKGNDVHLVCTIEGSKQYFSTSETVETDADGWEKLHLIFNVPPLNKFSDVKFYVWNSGKDTIYCDDIAINIVKYKPFPEYSLTPIHIEMDSSALLKIKETRKNAFKLGILKSKDDDWVKGFIFGGEKFMKAKLRLKGDWLDHLRGQKWSYRIKLKKNNAWNRKITFSIQNPMARLGVSEWLIHNLFMSEGILTTQIGFIPVTINGNNMGLYSWEEHFVKQLIESQNKREGPIVRFKEDALWDSRIYDSNGERNGKKTPAFDAAVIEPFSVGKTVKNPNLLNQFLIAQNLMMQYRKRLKPASEIFNISLLAKYYALSDVFIADHGLIWHNQRFYYNPVLCKLEPIAYDCYSDIGLSDKSKHPITGFLHNDITQPEEYIMVRELFNDTTFLAYYVSYLDKFSSAAFLDSVFSAYNHDIKYYDSLIMIEYNQSTFYKSQIFENAKNIRGELPKFEKQILDMKTAGKSWENTLSKIVDYDSVLPDYFAPNLVMAFKEKTIDDSVMIKVKSFFTEQVIILGVGSKSKKINNFVFPVPKIDASKNGVPTTVEFMISNSKDNNLFFSIPSSDNMYSIKINDWPEPDGTETPQQQLMSLYPMSKIKIIDKIDGKNIYFKSGVNIVNTPIIIPKGYNVHFVQGTTIDLLDSALFLSYSPIFIDGTIDNPVIITSSDSTANGFTVLQAEGKSSIKNAIFKNLGTLNYKNWTLSGSVCFYESDVNIYNTTFYHNHCEDALNIVRSNFILKNSSFDDIYSDAFDGDFCKGDVIGGTYTNIGNDAMDFSGSEITINDTKVIGANDKGISGGENSQIYVNNATIKNANIGIASKDLSVVDVANSKVDKCKYGIVLLQKKPEFGPSIIKLHNTNFTDCEKTMLIEEKSKVFIEKSMITGTEKHVAKMFY